MRRFRQRILIGFSCALLVGSASTCATADDSERSTIRTVSVIDEDAPPPIPQAVPQQATPIAVPTQSSARGTPPAAFPRFGAAANTSARPLVQPRVTSQTNQALNFYGGNPARSTLNQMPRTTPMQYAASQPQSMRPTVKPFQTVFREPTISPYLNLYRDEQDTESAPNYFALVRPQMDQIEANRTQQHDIQQIRGQLQGGGSTIAGVQSQSSGMPGTGTQARFMDTAQFYRGLRR